MHEGSAAAAVVHLAVDYRVRYSAPTVLMTACKEAAVTTPVGKKGGECSICLEALRQEQAVELPGCAASFFALTIDLQYSQYSH